MNTLDRFLQLHDTPPELTTVAGGVEYGALRRRLEAVDELEEACRQARTMLDGMSRTHELCAALYDSGFDLSVGEALKSLESAISICRIDNPPAVAPDDGASP